MRTHRRRVPRWVAVTVPLILCVGVAGCVAFYWPWIVRAPVGPARQPLPYTIEGPISSESDPLSWVEFGQRFIGHTEASIIERFGPPTDTWKGHYGLPRMRERQAYPEAVTHVYQRPSGRMYLSYCREKGKSVCFSATWLSEGSMF
jgi:hypothetical protein